MKLVVFAAIATLGLSAGSAYAAEGGGDPFPFRVPGVTTVTTGMAVPSGANDDPFPFRANGILITKAMSDRVLPTNGAEGSVQSANSIPPGANSGTGAYAENQTVQRYFQAQRTQAVARMAQHGSAKTSPSS